VFVTFDGVNYVTGINTTSNAVALGNTIIVSSNIITIGNSTVYSTLNATAFTGSANTGVASAGGSNTDIMFNDSGLINGNAALTFNKTTNTVTIGTATINSTSYSGSVNNATNANNSLYLGGLAANQYALAGSNGTTFIPQGYLYDLTLSAVGNTGTFGIANGAASDTTSASIMTLSSAITKTTSTWSAGSGNGGMDTGTVATGTWYHVHLIKDVSTSVVDVLFSLSVSSPTLPSGYTLSRRIGSMKTDGSSHWLPFIQIGDRFDWVIPQQDLNGYTGFGASLTAQALSVPLGVNVVAYFTAAYINSAAGGTIIFLAGYLSYTGSGFPGLASLYNTTTINPGFGDFYIPTNLLSEIAVATQTGSTVYIITRGWSDTRGRV